MNCFTKLWRVQLGDWGRGLVIAVIAAPVGIFYDWATMDSFAFTWQALLKGAVAGGIAYLGKNFITGTNGKLLTNK